MLVATGRVTASGEDAFQYRVECDPSWSVRFVSVHRPGGSLSLSADGRGRWTGAEGHVPALDGCVDVDIQDTPFTNTLPIRRLALREGESRTIPVAYVAMPSLRVEAVLQTYTCLRPGRTYRYSGYPPGFAADLSVDEDGLVVAYPGLFQRLPP